MSCTPVTYVIYLHSARLRIVRNGDMQRSASLRAAAQPCLRGAVEEGELVWFSLAHPPQWTTARLYRRSRPSSRKDLDVRVAFALRAAVEDVDSLDVLLSLQ